MLPSRSRYYLRVRDSWIHQRLQSNIDDSIGHLAARLRAGQRGERGFDAREKELLAGGFEAIKMRLGLVAP
jgi:hypothetical protein